MGIFILFINQHRKELSIEYSCGSGEEILQN